MAGLDFEDALDRHVAWGLRDLDLKDAIYGQNIEDLASVDAERARDQISARGLDVYCFSTRLFHGDVFAGEDAFRAKDLAAIDRVMAAADILQPTLIRLLAPQARPRPDGISRMQDVAVNAPWLFDLFGEAIDRITARGFGCTIENETADCIVRSPEDALELLARIGRPDTLSFTWDVQNMWECGVFPSVDVYEKLRPVIGYYHVKGGRSEAVGGPLVWRSSLADASWPVASITRKVIADGVSPVICINPPHGRSLDSANESYAESDISFLRTTFGEVL